MVAKFSILLLFVTVVSNNPAANTKWRWVPKRFDINSKSKLPEVGNQVQHQQPRTPVKKFTQVENCGYALWAPRRNGKVTGGFEESPHEFPWQAALFIDDTYFCGGTVISDEWVITAAHCVYNSSYVEIVLGAHDLTAHELSQRTLNSTEFIIHEEFVPATNQNDIAVIRLPRTITFTDFIQPICLPSPPDLGIGQIVTITGWGYLEEHVGPHNITPTLHYVDVPTIQNQLCEEYFGSRRITDNNICTNGADSHGVCQGDTGGPMNHDVAPYYNTTEIRGISSFYPASGCQAGGPDAFTRVTHYLDWIQANTGVTR